MLGELVAGFVGAFVGSSLADRPVAHHTVYRAPPLTPVAPPKPERMPRRAPMVYDLPRPCCHAAMTCEMCAWYQGFAYESYAA